MEWFKNVFRRRLRVVPVASSRHDREFVWSERDKIEVPERFEGQMTLEEWQAFVDRQIDLERNYKVVDIPWEFPIPPGYATATLECDDQKAQRLLWIRKDETLEEVSKRMGISGIAGNHHG